MRILLLSAYDGASHGYWRRGLVAALGQYQWTQLVLPGRHFSWRIRGNPLSWMHTEAAALKRRYDLIVATSMVDLATLKGLFPGLAATPTLCYFHENQFDYPAGEHQHPSLEPQMVNLYSALAADRILFNSAYNRDSFFRGVDQLMARLPDLRPRALSPLLAERAAVLPVPLFAGAGGEPPEVGRCAVSGRGNQRWQCPDDAVPIRIVWAARWEHDKGPGRLLAVMRELERRGTDFRICLLGERFRNAPAEFDTISQEFDHRLVQFGFVESRQEYHQWLATADIMLSTAIHEFQGLATLEGIASGCVPVLPDRLAYPELVPQAFLYTSAESDPAREAAAAADLIEYHHAQQTQAPCVKRFLWSELKSAYQRELLRFCRDPHRAEVGG